MEQETKTGELLIPESEQLEAYKPFVAQIAAMKQENATTVFDYADKKGNAEARSYVFKLRKSKAAIDKARAEAKTEALQIGRRIDSQAKLLIGEVEAMIEVHAKPLREIEEAEAARVKKYRDWIDGMIYQAEGATILEDLRRSIDYLQGLEGSEWGEFAEEAEQTRAKCLVLVRSKIELAERAEAERLELEKLRKEAAERAEADRIAAEKRQQDERDARAKVEREAEIQRAAAESAERARKEAQEAANAAAQKAIDDAVAATAAAEARETALKLQAEKAQREAAEAREQAERTARETEERIKREADAAAQKVQQEQQAREADRKHRNKVELAAVNALKLVGLDTELADKVIAAIIAGKVPAVTITY